MKNVIVTGSEGFIGKNLISHLKHSTKHKVNEFNSISEISDLERLINNSDFIFHLAGINRTKKTSKFEKVNFGLTKTIFDFVLKKEKKTDIFFSSSTQSENGSDYGNSKRKAEKILLSNKKYKGSIYISRLPNVFGKWSKPNYNSVVATFCFNIARNIPVNIHEGEKKIELLYIDDLIHTMIKFINAKKSFKGFIDIKPTKKITINSLYKLIKKCSLIQKENFIPNLSFKFNKNIYSTYLSFLPKENFSYNLIQNNDYRGNFVEFLKTNFSGQISFFTAKKNIVRGGHFHHTKSEKFLVLNGHALFTFINILVIRLSSIESGIANSLSTV